MTPPVRCVCGFIDLEPKLVYAPPFVRAQPVVVFEDLPVCKYRGGSAGSLSCGCGSAYRCTKLNIVCGDRKMVDELFTITLNTAQGSMQLDEVGYQCCGECAEFVADSAK